MRESTSAEWSLPTLHHWQALWEEYQRDTGVVEDDQAIDQQRAVAQREMQAVLNQFLANEMTVGALNAVFQHKTHREWQGFGIRGPVGIFFNKVIKHTGPHDELTTVLQTVLPVVSVSAQEQWEGQQRMEHLEHWLAQRIASGQTSREAVQPARVPFFVSTWWQMQRPERWPIFYRHVQRVLVPQAYAVRTIDPIPSYFVFRAALLSLAAALSRSLWEIEHLCTWYAQQIEQGKKSLGHPQEGFAERPSGPTESGVWTTKGVSLGAEEREVMPPPLPQSEDERRRIHLLWMLAKLGAKVGCRAWIAQDDHHQQWQQERLSEVSVESLSAFSSAGRQAVLSRIDVLWLQKGDPVAAYQVVRTPEDLTVCLLHLYDLAMLFPRRTMYLGVVVEGGQRERLRREWMRPWVQKQSVHKQCTVLAQEVLFVHEEHVLRWATDLLVVQDLTKHAGVSLS